MDKTLPIQMAEFRDLVDLREAIDLALLDLTEQGRGLYFILPAQ
ncbi:MAG: hypothetical protein WBA57_00930 [Elainellaceae cyanobacterium]